MSKFLLRKAKIFDTRSKYHLTSKDLLIESGRISKIANSIPRPKNATIITSPNLCVSPGWMDIGTFNGEPGFEYREDLESLGRSAVAGGYSRLAPFPTSDPTIDNIGQLHFLTSHSERLFPEILPIASLSKNREGTEFSDLLDLHHHGAKAFSDGLSNGMSSDQFQRSLIYLKSFNGIAIYCPHRLDEYGLHEGAISVSLGMPGSPEHEEENLIVQAISQNSYANSRILIHNISTSGILKKVKASDLRQVSFSVPFMNLIYRDEDLIEFDLNLKVIPPLRSETTRKALCKSVEAGQINVISSNHTPLSIEEKDQPFGLSMPGASTLQTVFSAMNTLCSEISLERLVYCLSQGPYESLGIDTDEIRKGIPANLTLFDPTLESSQTNHSKSDNNPFIEKPLKGKIIGIINGLKSSIKS